MPPQVDSPVTRTRAPRNNTAATTPTVTASNPPTTTANTPSPSSPNNETTGFGSRFGNAGVLPLLRLLRALAGLVVYIALQVQPFYSLWIYSRQAWQGGWTCGLLLPSLVLNCWGAWCSVRNCVQG
jgi:hypothetical protein